MKSRLTPPQVLTKLRPPAPTTDIVPRRQLADFVERVLAHRLTLVCAAAGYGKTTLLSTLCKAPWPLAWYSLGKSDVDPMVFLYCLRNGLRNALSSDADFLLENVPEGARTRDDLEAHLAHLVNGLSELPHEHIIIVLDDFHFIEGSESLVWFANRLIASIPPNTHLVLSSRTSFSIPSVPKLRVSGAVFDIHQYDLRFDSEEALQLFEKSHCLTLSRPFVESLVGQVEGWPIGLQLAAQTLSQRPKAGAEDFLSKLSRVGQPLFEYLVEEVFNQQPREVQDFLLRTSILSRLDEETCDAVRSRRDSGQMLHRILRGNVFLSPMEQNHFRYHQLFRDFLRERLAQDQEEFALAHTAAAEHFRRTGEEELAIYHLLAAKKYDQAAEMISTNCDRVIRTSRFDTFAYWIHQLPTLVLDKFPELLFRRGEIDHICGRYDSSLQWYDRAARVYRAREDMIGLSRVLQRKGRILNWRVGEPQNAERLHNQALAYLGEEHKSERAALLSDLARDRMSAGELSLGFQLFHQAIQIYEELGEAGREGQLATLINPGSWLYLDRGDFCQSIALLQRAAGLATELGCTHQLAECYNTLSSHLFLWGKVEESRAYAEKALELSSELGSHFGQGVALMNLANAIGNESDVRSTEFLHWHRKALDIFETAGNRRFCIATLNFMSMACRQRGLMSEAARYAQQAFALAKAGSAPWLVAWSASNLGIAKIDSNIAQTVGLLEQAMDTFQNYEDKHNLTQVRLWLALALHRTNSAIWLDHLRACLQLAREGDYGYALVREKRLALPLFIEALHEGVEVGYVSEILSDLGGDAVEPLLPLVESAASNTRVQVIRALSKMRDSRSWKVIFRCTRDPDEEVRFAAKAALAWIQPPEPFLLDIYCLGPFQVFLGDKPIAEEDWKRKKVKSLLKYVVTSRGACATKDEIMEGLWPGLDPDAANNNFYRTLHHLRRLLDNRGGPGSVLFDGGIVRIPLDLVARIDLEDFQQLVRQGREKAATGDLHSAQKAWEAAIQLYMGDFLADDPYEDWTHARREGVRDMYLTTLAELGELNMLQLNWDVACDLFRRALAYDNSREDIHLRLMSCLASSGNYSEAIRQYRRCERALREELETEPAPETKAFLQQILAKSG